MTKEKWNCIFFFATPRYCLECTRYQFISQKFSWGLRSPQPHQGLLPWTPLGRCPRHRRYEQPIFKTYETQVRWKKILEACGSLWTWNQNHSQVVIALRRYRGKPSPSSSTDISMLDLNIEPELVKDWKFYVFIL